MRREMNSGSRSAAALALSLLLVVAACSEKSGIVEPPPAEAGEGVYIVNEGNFNRGNATVSFYLPDSNRVYDDIFEEVNHRRLGDTGNSLAIRNGKAYIVVNGSNRIEIIDIRTQKSSGIIQSPTGASPRHIAFASDAKAYISNLFDNSVSVVDVESGNVTGRIPVGNNPEEMLIDGGTLYVVNSGFGKGRSVSVIDISADVVTASLSVGDGPLHIRRWKADTAVVLCQGDFGDFNDPTDDTPGALYFIDLNARRVVDSIALGGHPFEAAIDADGRFYTLYSGEGILRIDLAARKAANDYFIRGNFYTVACDAKRGWIYVTDPKDYLQPGTVSRYDLQGGMLGSFAVGINPGWIEIFP